MNVPIPGARHNLTRLHPVWLAIGACAVAVGVIARFRAIGSAPLAVDEYFIVRSVQNLLHHGVPAFDCGGLYTRGILLQYVAAALVTLGVPLEQAPRLICATAGVLTLPMVFLIGRRVQGTAVGLLAVILLALSVWEIEMSRFGRMYAPFQLVFVCYLWFYLRRTVDADRHAHWIMLGLTLIGTLLWEGGALMALGNFLPAFLGRGNRRLDSRDVLELTTAALVLAAVYEFITTDFRTLGAPAALPSGFDPDTAHQPLDFFSAAPPLTHLLWVQKAWLALFVIPLGGAIVAARTVLKQHGLGLPALGLIAALAAALAHLFFAAGAILFFLVLVQLISWQDLSLPAGRSLHTALLLSVVFWVAFAIATYVPADVASRTKSILLLVYPFVSVPDVIGQIVRPWAAAAPILGFGLLAALVAGFVWVTRQPAITPARAILALVFGLLLAASASHPPRHETRYVFFLYPAAIVLALAALQSMAQRMMAGGPRATIAATVVALAAFMLSEDFQPRHLLWIDRPEMIFKPAATPGQQSHLVVRDDTRALAQWLQHNAAEPGNIVVNAVQGLDFYDSHINYFYVDRGDFNFADYACRRGAIDRWSNLPLLQSAAAIDRVAAVSDTTYVVTYSDRLGPLLAQLVNRRPRVTWTSGHLAIVALAGGDRRTGAR